MSSEVGVTDRLPEEVVRKVRKGSFIFIAIQIAIQQVATVRLLENTCWLPCHFQGLKQRMKEATHTCTHICTRTHTYTHTHTQNTHTHTHTHTHKQLTLSVVLVSPQVFWSFWLVLPRMPLRADPSPVQPLVINGSPDWGRVVHLTCIHTQLTSLVCYCFLQGRVVLLLFSSGECVCPLTLHTHIAHKPCLLLFSSGEGCPLTLHTHIAHEPCLFCFVLFFTLI